jgi:hypothetical protein
MCVREKDWRGERLPRAIVSDMCTRTLRLFFLETDKAVRYVMQVSTLNLKS